ncbi:hypothetical protein N8751_00975 [bacterium]|nr:hypothetical protein [bacterium]
MFVSVEDNRCQILVSSIIGFLVYFIYKNELLAAAFVIIMSYILRVCNFDGWIKSMMANKENNV